MNLSSCHNISLGSPAFLILHEGAASARKDPLPRAKPNIAPTEKVVHQCVDDAYPLALRRALPREHALGER